MNEKEDKRSLIIDSITHVTPDGQWFQTHYDASELRLIQEMESAGVARAVVVALAGYSELQPHFYLSQLALRMSEGKFCFLQCWLL